MQEEQIKGYFAFEENDLIANREGRLSEKQTKRIKDADRFADQFLLALFLLLLSGAIFLAILAFYRWNNIGLWIGTIVVFLVAMWIYRGVRTEIDDRVQKVQGKVDFVKVEKQTGSASDPSYKRSKVSSYEMRVGDEAFANVNSALIEYMQGGIYAVYFTKTTRQILSVEAIAEAKQPILQPGESA